MKKMLINLFTIALALYVISCVVLYFYQEKLLFFPEKLENDYQFQFQNTFEEINTEVTDGRLLNGLLFKADTTKGLIFYLHGNAGSLANWGDVTKTYTDLNYDVFILDYRGYGKSEGEIKSQDEIFHDNQVIYNALKKKYNEEKITILGYSIGTGFASKLASDNNPKHLILQAPYYSLTDLMRNTYSILPTFILRYKLETNEYLKKCKMPITLFHGDNDEVIYYNSSVKLNEAFKKQTTLITLENQGHNGMTDNEQYKAEIKRILQ
ncbi:alpha/beta hydrolase [Flavobacterium jumunjinense]|uniref:Alpha/beta hydrolase n=2 Tax=Flavobacteriaceae TaxID=49546 RepID=A0ABV5GRN7_9FLAO